MALRRIRVSAYFDGTALHDRGPYDVAVRDGVIASIAAARETDGRPDIATAFALPGLTDAHAHVFLDGARRDPADRAAYLASDREAMLATARANVGKCTRAGVTLMRDAGDMFGINHAIREELRADKDALLRLRSAGCGLRRKDRYGRLLACEVDEARGIAAIVRRMCEQADDIKIMLTGIVDFAAGTVKGAPQFDLDETRLIVTEARRHGRRTFAHCSGLTGLEIAVAAQVDSIEHGFFMTRDILERMADKGIAWVPTFAPVKAHFAATGPDDPARANLQRILAAQAEHVAMAHARGVAVLAGSDAGSPGVDHGSGLVDEMLHLLQAGLPMAAVLNAATARPRALWGMAPVTLAPGEPADMILLRGSPFADPQALRDVRCVIRADACHLAEEVLPA